MPRFVPPPLPRRGPESSSDDEVDSVFKPLPSLEYPGIQPGTAGAKTISRAATEYSRPDTPSNSDPTVPREPSESTTSTSITFSHPHRDVAPDFPNNLIGTTLLDRYRVIEILGEGGMGVVLMGEHITIGRKVAIKILKLQAARFPEKAKERFLREARMISMINHDNVVQISDFGQTADGLPFFIMEYLEGEDLSLLLRREGRQSWSRVKTIAIQICRALRAAHSVGVIHRDMKLENCFMVARPDVDEVVKVLDFGVAKIIEGDGEQKQDGDRPLTRTGDVVGTAAYMAPEQAKGEHLDARTDLYSVGVMLYELLVGRRPFDADSIFALMHKQAFEAPRRPSEVVPEAGISSLVEAIILKALEKDPADRYQSAGEMIEAIEVVSARMPTHPNLAGETLQGRYRLIERIGEGGMGTVYVARHTTIGRRLAVKILHNEYVRLYKGRFLQEAKAASQITHDNVVQITDYGETHGGQPFLVMEHLEGECLSDTIEREGRLPWSRVKHIAIQISRGLQAAHDAGIVHRDVKPDNCFRVSTDDDEDHIKLLDFGIARMASAGPKLTVTGEIFGTTAYMSPEQVRGDKDVDQRADVYSTGIMMYEMLAGTRPFDGTDDWLLHQHVHVDPPPLQERAPNARIPEGAAAVVHKAIAKAPADRYQSMREMMHAIAAVRDVPAPVDAPVPVAAPAPVSAPAPVAAPAEPSQNSPELRNLLTGDVRSSVVGEIGPPPPKRSSIRFERVSAPPVSSSHVSVSSQVSVVVSPPQPTAARPVRSGGVPPATPFAIPTPATPGPIPEPIPQSSGTVVPLLVGLVLVIGVSTVGYAIASAYNLIGEDEAPTSTSDRSWLDKTLIETKEVEAEPPVQAKPEEIKPVLDAPAAEEAKLEPAPKPAPGPVKAEKAEKAKPKPVKKKVYELPPPPKPILGG
jgi:serine/threonine protein kinase